MVPWRWLLLLGIPALHALSWWVTGTLSAPGSPDLGRVIVVAPASNPAERNPSPPVVVGTDATVSPPLIPAGQVAAPHLAHAAGQRVASCPSASWGRKWPRLPETARRDFE